MGFEWDESKERQNVERHGIDFSDAAEIVLAVGYDRRSDRHGEVRWCKTGEFDGKLWTVVYTKRGLNIRIISTRRAWKNEERSYRSLHSRGDQGEAEEGSVKDRLGSHQRDDG